MEALLIWGLVLLTLAFAVVVIGLFIPTAGILAAVALVLAVGGVVCLFRYDTTWGVIGSLLVVIGGPGLFIVGFKLVPHTPLGTRLIVVLGHERCGAVTAAVGGGELPGHLPALMTALQPAVAAHRDPHGDPVEGAIRANIELTADLLRASGPILAELVEKGELKIVGARYDLDTGIVEWLDGLAGPGHGAAAHAAAPAAKPGHAPAHAATPAAHAAKPTAHAPAKTTAHDTAKPAAHAAPAAKPNAEPHESTHGR